MATARSRKPKAGSNLWAFDSSCLRQLNKRDVLSNRSAFLAALNSTAKGNRAVSFAIAFLLDQGYTVLLPFGEGHPYDLVLDAAGKFLRIQCKTGRLVGPSVVFATYSMTGRVKKPQKRYYHGLVDWFAVFCKETDSIYWVRPEECPKGEASIRVGAGAGNQFTSAMLVGNDLKKFPR